LRRSLSLLQDVAFTNDNPAAVTTSGNITALAREGIILDQHYVHWHCSPSRRSFLTGRLPLHHGEQLSGITTDDIDLRWTWISEKLKRAANYSTFWYGKGHTGYMSMNHLPVNRGFDAHAGFLSGAGSYMGPGNKGFMQRWRGDRPADPTSPQATGYSTDVYGQLALDALRAHDPSRPFFLYLPWQAVHAPYDKPPWCVADVEADGGGVPAICSRIEYAMLQDADVYMGALTALLKGKGMWDNAIVVYTADNGGVDSGADGINWPLRGEKHTNWEGGMRGAAFVSGGLVPAHLRGTRNGGTFHVVDWYPTLCGLAGLSPAQCADDSPVAPLKPSPAHPNRDIYQGNLSWPGLDGQDIWPALLAGDTGKTTGTATGNTRTLWLSAEVLIEGDYKLVVAQPNPDIMSAKTIHNGWRFRNGTWDPSSDAEYGCNAYKDRTRFRPCLFDLAKDPQERVNLAASMPARVASMWTALNTSALTAFQARSPAALLGPCEPKCAQKVWKKDGAKGHRGLPKPGKGAGPICGVPGCGKGADAA